MNLKSFVALSEELHHIHSDITLDNTTRCLLIQVPLMLIGSSIDSYSGHDALAKLLVRLGDHMPDKQRWYVENCPTGPWAIIELRFPMSSLEKVLHDLSR